MKIERHETGPRMSKAVIHGETVYLAGIVADRLMASRTGRDRQDEATFCQHLDHRHGEFR